MFGEKPKHSSPNTPGAPPLNLPALPVEENEAEGVKGGISLGSD